MMRCSIIAASFALLPIGVAAEGCGALLGLLDGSGGFAGGACRNIDTERGPARSCNVKFNYRSAVAQERFDKLRKDIEQCIRGAELLPSNASVNHPDTHSEEIFAIPGGRIVISLKDKARLGQSFVFITITEDT